MTLSSSARTNQEPVRSIKVFKMSSTLFLFLTKLLNEHFSNCSLLTVKDKFKEETETAVFERAVILPKIMIRFYNDTDTRLTSISSPHVSVQLSNARHHHSDHCILTLFLISYNMSLNFLSRVKDLAFARKDIDHFIFVLESPKHRDTILKMDKFLGKIKFKIAIGMNNDNQLEITSLDFFGGANGSPRIVRMPVSNSNKNILFPDFTWNMRGYTLQIAIPYAKSLLESKPPPWTETNNGKRGRWKYLIEDFLMVKFNFTYRMFPSSGLDGKFGAGGTGVQLAGGRWTGVTGDLYYGRADVGLAIANTDKRIKYIGFTDTNFDAGCLTFVTGQPSEVYSTLAIFWPFIISVWILIIVCTLGTMGFFFLVTKSLQKLQLESLSITTGVEIRLIVASFVEQDSPIMPVSSALRTFVAFWSFFALIVTNLYRSKLVTLLVFPELGKLPTTFEELAASDFQIGFMKNGDSAFNTFSRSKDSVYVEITRRMEVIKGVNFECLRKVVSSGKYACIAYDFDVVYLQQKNFSDVNARKLKYSNARTYNIWLGIATQAQSIYRVNFGKVLGQTLPFHLSYVWDSMDMYANVRKPKLKWWAETNQTYPTANDEESQSELTLSNIIGVFHVFLYCIMASIFVFLYEHRKSSFWLLKIKLCGRITHIRSASLRNL